MNPKRATKPPAISAVNIESIFAMIADTGKGLTDSEITKLLADSLLNDPSPELN
jgi:hypothetical protein